MSAGVEVVNPALFFEKALGTRGVKWGKKEKEEWFTQQSIKRSYHDEVVTKIDGLRERYEVIQYGKLSLDVNDYPLFGVKSRNWDNAKKTVLVTGGVHGYETSGVQGALRFMETRMADYEVFNFIVCPCIGPWAYETINRWNSEAVDPNRSFVLPNTPENNKNHIEETTLVMDFITAQMKREDQKVDIIMHIDLHETTDTDVTTFGPALAARDGIDVEETTIPDGFYLVGNSDRPEPAFNAAIVEGVSRITHLVPDSATLLGEPVAHRAVICAPARMLGLCMGFTDAPYVTTTEVYPDSPTVTDEDCTLAQVAAVTSGLDYILSLN